MNRILQEKLIRKVKLYFFATRPQLTIAFCEVIFGILYATNFNIISINYIQLIKLFVIFQMLYSGIYIFNDVADYNEDKQCFSKRKRIIAGNKINTVEARKLSIILIFSSLVLCYQFLPQKILLFEIFFLIYNLIYTYILKIVPYIYPLSGGITRSTRVLMGMVLYSNVNILILVLYYLVWTINNTIKKYDENIVKITGKHNYERYNNKYLFVSIITITIVYIYILSNISIENISYYIISILMSLTILLSYISSQRLKKYFRYFNGY